MSMFKKANSSTEKSNSCESCANADICRYKDDFIEMEKRVLKVVERESACYKSSDLLYALITCNHRRVSFM